ncbi:MAG: hypothetical protein LBD08_04405 [Treponema sp.]|jgi:hypothetical protein|nr:hypothetical protein [Treponema sp.]
MDVIIEFNEAAFRHGISREDILYAYRNRICDALIDGLPEKYAVIGFDRAGNPLEIMYNPIDDNRVNIFHAMKARDSFIKTLGL